jgi:hypothetical protein
MPITEIGSKPPEARENGKVGCKIKKVKFTLQQAIKAQGGVEE